MKLQNLLTQITSFCLLNMTLVANAQLNTSLFNQNAMTEPVTTVNCTLSNGSSTQCYQLKFYANVVNDDGPFCPQTINDIGGLAIYEPGAAGTNVGLAALNADLLNIIEADGFDIVQSNGDVNINIPGAGGGPPAQGTSYCLQANSDDNLELTYLIPVNPENLTTPNNIEPVEQLGVSLDGIPFKGNPPAVIGGGPGGGGTDVLMPALDRCGGHHDPGGYYHWHMIANSTNDVLNDLNISAVSCTAFPQTNSSIMGYAMDGYPIYGQFEEGQILPSGLDACNGHFSVTSDYPNGIYHYHAVQGVAPNIPPCLIGASATGSFTYNFHENDLYADEIINISLEGNLYPNPTNNETVTIESSAEKLEIYDQNGRQIDGFEIVQKIEGGFSVEPSALNTGSYQIVLLKGNARITKTLVVTSN